MNGIYLEKLKSRHEPFPFFCFEKHLCLGWNILHNITRNCWSATYPNINLWSRKCGRQEYTWGWYMYPKHFGDPILYNARITFALRAGTKHQNLRYVNFQLAVKNRMTEWRRPIVRLYKNVSTGKQGKSSIWPLHPAHLRKPYETPSVTQTLTYTLKH